MKRRRSFPATWLGGCFAGLALVASSARSQESAPAETDKPQAELKETQKRLQAFEAENATLRRQNEVTRQSLTALADSLAEANAEAELFRRQYASLKLRMEALGVGMVSDGREALEQRLLKGVRDLELVRQQKEVLGERLLALVEAVFRYLKTTPGAGDPGTRLDVEAELRATNEALGNPVKRAAEGGAVPSSLHEGLVVSVKEEWSLLVANVGSKQGVKLGMPLTVVRGDAFVGRARVIDVREAIAGAVVEEVSPGAGKVRVGDQLRLEVQF